MTDRDPVEVAADALMDEHVHRDSKAFADWRSFPADVAVRDAIATALRTAEARGAEGMREAAAEYVTREWLGGSSIAQGIRALPLSDAPASPWRDMQSAPKDGTRFLAHTPSDIPAVLFWHAYDADDAAEIGEDGYWAFAEELLNDIAGGSAQPTLWMPIPDLPTPPATKDV